jgi:hypothetical protein
MNATTYRDPRVLALLAEHFVVMRVDEAARPDLRERYAAWGWPATALLTPDAQPIVNLRGHQPPAQFAELLQRAIDGRQAIAPIAARAKPASSLEQAYTQARAQLDSFYDAREGGWGSPQKYPFSAPIEEALWRGADVTTSLRGYRALIDPVAGGMFQYSLEGVWTKPHYEKLLSIQAGAIASFSAAHRAGAGFLADAQQVAHYALATLRAPDGAFYTSQAADVATVGERGFVPGAVYYGSAVRGTPPSLDTNVYADLNGMMIAALCELYRADGDATWLQAARGAHAAVRRRLARGPAFLHAANLTDAFYLSDQVELARAGYALSLASGEPALARSGCDRGLDDRTLARSRRRLRVERCEAWRGRLRGARAAVRRQCQARADLTVTRARGGRAALACHRRRRADGARSTGAHREPGPSDCRLLTRARATLESIRAVLGRRSAQRSSDPRVTERSLA